jgi:hypothetical protein
LERADRDSRLLRWFVGQRDDGRPVVNPSSAGASARANTGRPPRPTEPRAISELRTHAIACAAARSPPGGADARLRRTFAISQRRLFSPCVGPSPAGRAHSVEIPGTLSLGSVAQAGFASAADVARARPSRVFAGYLGMSVALSVVVISVMGWGAGGEAAPPAHLLAVQMVLTFFSSPASDVSSRPLPIFERTGFRCPGMATLTGTCSA